MPLTLKEYNKNPFGINDHDAVLLKLHRLYGEKEGVKFLFQTIDVLKLRIIDLDELLYALKKENEELRQSVKSWESKKSGIKQYSKDEYVIELKNQIANSRVVKNEYKKKTTEWQNKYFSLLAKQNKINEQ